MAGALTARADPVPEREPGPAQEQEPSLEVRQRSKLFDEGPRLELDPTVRPALEGLGGVEDTHRSRLDLGPRTKLVVEGVSWVNDATGASEDTLGRPGLDLDARGWRARVRLSHDFGPVRLDAFASLNQVATRYGGGSYVDLGISLTKTMQLSSHMTGWVSLGVGVRRWQRDKPVDENNSTQLKLSIGTTFR